MCRGSSCGDSLRIFALLLWKNFVLQVSHDQYARLIAKTDMIACQDQINSKILAPSLLTDWFLVWGTSPLAGTPD